MFKTNLVDSIFVLSEDKVCKFISKGFASSKLENYSVTAIGIVSDMKSRVRAK